MIDGLPRGYDLDKNNKIRKEIICGDEWRIYLTNRETYALLVSPELFQTWVNYINGDIFQPIEEYSLYVSSTQEYIISSLRSGPYPDQVNQVQAFSAAYGQFMIHYPGVYFSDAIYIEELSLLLPLKESETAEDMAICYGMWLTGGVAIPGDNVKRLSSFMTWMPSKSLNKCLELAGIDNQLNEEQESEILVKKDEGNKDGKGSFHLVGRPDLETFFKDKIIDIIEHEDEYTRMGISFPGATILYGPPGCGKTYAVERLSEYLKWPKFSIEAGSVASPYIHDTSKKIAEVFENAIHMAPSILIIDEMEAFLSDRGAVSAGNHHIEEVAEFLRRIPEAIEHHVLIFGMTNMIDSIDSAILRRGRFDYTVEVKMATAEEIKPLLMKRFEELPIADNVDPQSIAEYLSGHPLSDVSFVLKEAGRIAVKEHKKMIDHSCFQKALMQIHVDEKTSRRIGF